jgi:hypothetical protein
MSTSYLIMPGTPLGTSRIFHVIVEGRPALRVVADLSDPSRCLTVTAPNGTNVTRTEYPFEVTYDEVRLIEDADGHAVGVVPGLPRVDERSVESFVATLYRMYA